MNTRCFLCLLCIIPVFKVTGLQKGALNTDSIFFRVYIGKNIFDYVDIPVNNAIGVLRLLSPQKKTVFYFHGFDESIDSNSVKWIADAHLRNGHYNIVALDYSILVKNSYVEAVIAAPQVADRLTKIFNEFIRKGWKKHNLHIIGHSLGAQVCGFIGRNVAFRFPRITGLDPAGPLFNVVNQRLTAEDADFVDIIHTDSKFYGIFLPTGHVDFYPNGGTRIQPGCPLRAVVYSDDDFCSHHRSFRFYAESLTRNSLLASNCPGFIQFKLGICSNNDKVLMGHLTPHFTRGTYYLSTSSAYPFGLGFNGSVY